MVALPGVEILCAPEVRKSIPVAPRLSTALFAKVRLFLIPRRVPATFKVPLTVTLSKVEKLDV